MDFGVIFCSINLKIDGINLLIKTYLLSDRSCVILKRLKTIQNFLSYSCLFLPLPYHAFFRFEVFVLSSVVLLQYASLFFTHGVPCSCSNGYILLVVGLLLKLHMPHERTLSYDT